MILAFRSLHWVPYCDFPRCTVTWKCKIKKILSSLGCFSLECFLSHWQKGNLESALEVLLLLVTKTEFKIQVVLHLRIKGRKVMSPCFKKKKGNWILESRAGHGQTWTSSWRSNSKGQGEKGSRSAEYSHTAEYHRYRSIKGRGCPGASSSVNQQVVEILE